MASGKPFAIAALWRAWEESDGAPSLSFTMLTVNANEHPLMKRFHKPGDEKRSVVIVPPATYEDWLGCRNTDEARSFLNLVSRRQDGGRGIPAATAEASNWCD
jgi:putative SOS response-associated peptidase YedK